MLLLWNLDITKGQGTGIINKLVLFHIFYQEPGPDFTITGASSILCQASKHIQWWIQTLR